MNAFNTTGFTLNVEIPCIGCDICNRSTFTPPGVWDGSREGVPPAVTLRRIVAKQNQYPARFTIDGCADPEETRNTALRCGWSERTLSDRTVLICPKCQTLLGEICTAI